ncbi:MAG: hypothetical protein KatS3mg008_0489 [Acidimicrobiales bacterium]|nr:MAG: hypothetical protein KatS3mg008_0489 [Acidimicrobiales bacterium]
MTRAAPEFIALLDLQDIDRTIMRLEEQRANLPQRSEVARIESEVTELVERLDGLDRELHAAVAERRRLEDELASLEEKIAAEEGRLYGGGVTSPKEALAVQEELRSLGQHKDALEERVIECLEREEPLLEERERLEAQRALLAQQLDEARGVLREQERDLDVQLEQERGRRAEAAGRIPGELLAHYESLRTRMGGVAASRLVGSACTGCNLTLSAVFLDEIRHLPPDVLVHCDECGRILIRAG